MKLSEKLTKETSCDYTGYACCYFPGVWNGQNSVELLGMLRRANKEPSMIFREDHCSPCDTEWKIVVCASESEGWCEEKLENHVNMLVEIMRIYSNIEEFKSK